MSTVGFGDINPAQKSIKLLDVDPAEALLISIL